MQPHAAPLVLYFVSLHSDGLLDFSKGTMRGDSLDKWWSSCFRDAQERDEVSGVVKGRGKFGEGKWGSNAYREWFGARGVKGYVGE